MRTLTEIQKDIDSVNSEIEKLCEQKDKLNRERRERIFFNFCAEYGLKKGDIVKLTTNRTLMVEGIDRNWSGFILCRKIKKDGNPSIIYTSVLRDKFDGCKVIGHKDF